MATKQESKEEAKKIINDALDRVHDAERAVRDEIIALENVVAVHGLDAIGLRVGDRICSVGKKYEVKKAKIVCNVIYPVGRIIRKDGTIGDEWIIRRQWKLGE